MSARGVSSILTITIIIGILFGAEALAQETGIARLDWVSQNLYNDPGGYKIHILDYFSFELNPNVPNTIDIPDNTNTVDRKVIELPVGTYSFAISAYSLSGEESPLFNYITKSTIPKPIPLPPVM